MCFFLLKEMDQKIYGPLELRNVRKGSEDIENLALHMQNGFGMHIAVLKTRHKLYLPQMVNNELRTLKKLS